MVKRRGSVAGFTVLELLLAMAILVGLLALLIPGFSSAKDDSYRTTSLSNLRQVGMALLLYEGDHDGLAPTTNLDPLVAEKYVTDNRIFLSHWDNIKDGFGVAVQKWICENGPNRHLVAKACPANWLTRTSFEYDSLMVAQWSRSNKFQKECDRLALVVNRVNRPVPPAEVHVFGMQGRVQRFMSDGSAKASYWGVESTGPRERSISYLKLFCPGWTYATYDN